MVEFRRFISLEKILVLKSYFRLLKTTCVKLRLLDPQPHRLRLVRLFVRLKKNCINLLMSK